jgi:uncharacterized protein
MILIGCPLKPAILSKEGSMKILISGSSGLVGSHLVPFLRQKGHEVKKLVRHTSSLALDEIYWDPTKGELNPSDIQEFDAIINLAGENLGKGRWNEAKKQRILESRVKSTQLLAETISQLKNKPKVFINASAIGIYGEQGDEELNEESPEGKGFLSQVCHKWEAAANPIKEQSIRTVWMRLGMVLSTEGGGLKPMLVPFRLGLGGKLGSGKQFMSWIVLEDLLKAILFALTDDKLQGPVNAVSPNPVTNSTFTEVLGSVLHRPTWMPVPSMMAKLIFGEMADALILSSTRVFPKRLEEAGFQFDYPNLKLAFQHLLNNSQNN